MVNFSDKKIIHTGSHVGSKEYETLVMRGYTRVGVFKASTANVPIFWDAEYFEPRDKYLHQKP
jgi:hypothetical protein